MAIRANPPIGDGSVNGNNIRVLPIRLRWILYVFVQLSVSFCVCVCVCVCVFLPEIVYTAKRITYIKDIVRVAFIRHRACL